MSKRTFVCPRCGVLKSAVTHARRGNWFRSYCRKCESERAMKRDREDREGARRRARNWGRANKDKVHSNHLRQKFGISIAEYNRMFSAQNECCAICRQPETSTFRGKVRRLHVDHDHDTGRVRALLCLRCNVALGCVRENVSTLFAMAKYLRRHRDLVNMQEYIAYLEASGCE